MMDSLENFFSIGFISISEVRAETSRVDFGGVDVLIAFGSFEPRCTALASVRRLEAKRGVVFRFAPPKDGGDNGRSASAQVLVGKFREKGIRTCLIELPESVKFEDVRAKVARVFRALVVHFGRSFSVGLDISSCPKILFSYIISSGFATGMVSRFQLHYAETDYLSKISDAKNTTDADRFTDGPWIAAQVPYLEGRFMGSRPRHAVVAMGADAASVEKLVRRYDPDAMTLLCPIPGANIQIQNLTIQSSKRISRGYTHVKELSVHPFSAVEMARRVSVLCAERKGIDDLIFFCLGSKPHSLGMSLAAFATSFPQVVFRVPSSYSERRNAANGWSWVYTIRDRSNPIDAGYLETARAGFSASVEFNVNN
jgi:hypothetical protein